MKSNNTHNIKHIITGIIIGSAVTLSISVLANFEAIPNAFPIKLNGNDISLEGYNINGSTYFKLRDIGDKVGFGVDFADNTINITMVNTLAVKPTPAPVANPTPIPTVESNKQSDNTSSYKGLSSDRLSIDRSIDIADYEGISSEGAGYGDVLKQEVKEYTSDGLKIYVINGKKYVDEIDVSNKYSSKYEDSTYNEYFTLREFTQANGLQIGRYCIFILLSDYEYVVLPKIK